MIRYASIEDYFNKKYGIKLQLVVKLIKKSDFGEDKETNFERIK